MHQTTDNGNMKKNSRTLLDMIQCTFSASELNRGERSLDDKKKHIIGSIPISTK